jgi:hypothetical protein
MDPPSAPDASGRSPLERWTPGHWGIGLVVLDCDDRVAELLLYSQPADATWEVQRDMPGAIEAAHRVSGWSEVVWATPDGRLFFLEPHDEKDLPELGAQAQRLRHDVRFDQSALLDDEVERRRRGYTPEPPELPMYWWFLYDPTSGKVVLSDPQAPPAYHETPTEARKRLGLRDALGGFVYPRDPSPWLPTGGVRVTTEDHDAVQDDSAVSIVLQAIKRQKERLLEAGAAPYWWEVQTPALRPPAGTEPIAAQGSGAEPGGSDPAQRDATDGDEQVHGPFIFDTVYDGLVVIPVHEARRLAALNDALASSSSWDELLARVADDREATAYLESPEVTDSFEWGQYARESFYEDESEYDEYVFDADEVPGVLEGAWPPSPKRLMLRWLPASVKALGKTWDAVNGPFLHLEEDLRDEVIASMHAEGLECEPDTEGLVSRSCGVGRDDK